MRFFCSILFLTITLTTAADTNTKFGLGADVKSSAVHPTLPINVVNERFETSIRAQVGCGDQLEVGVNMSGYTPYSGGSVDDALSAFSSFNKRMAGVDVDLEGFVYYITQNESDVAQTRTLSASTSVNISRPFGVADGHFLVGYNYNQQENLQPLLFGFGISRSLIGFDLSSTLWMETDQSLSTVLRSNLSREIDYFKISLGSLFDLGEGESRVFFNINILIDDVLQDQY